MRARGIAVAAAIIFSSFLATALITCVSVPLNAQSPASTSENPGPALPADIQTKLDKLQAKLKRAQKKRNASAQAAIHNAIGDSYYVVSDFLQSEDEHAQALKQASTAMDVKQQVAALYGMGNCDRQLSRNEKALDDYKQALDLATSAGDPSGQAAALNGMGGVNAEIGQLQKALELQTRALPLAQKAKDKRIEGDVLSGIGDVNFYQGKRHEALDYYAQALTLFRQSGDRVDEADTLLSVGSTHLTLSENQRALDFYQQALDVARQVDDRYHEAYALNGAAVLYAALGEPQKALDSYNQALPIHRQLNDRHGEATALNRVGQLYSLLGDDKKALDFFNQALSIRREVGDRRGEAATLYSMAVAYFGLGEREKALDFFKQDLTMVREVGDRQGEADALNGIGGTYLKLGEKEKALDFLSQTLPVWRALGDRAGEARALNNIGFVDFNLGENQKALDYYNQALPIAIAVNAPFLEAPIFRNLMLVQKADKPALAIFYGKQAVNVLQRVRSNIQASDKELQQSFLTSKSAYFHDLADLLIDQGRLPEAQQVLDLLKEQEYRDYVRGDTSTLSQLTLTPAEIRAEEDYDKATGQIVALGEQWSALKKIAGRTPEQERQFQQISGQLDAASKGLNDYYARLYTLLGNNNEANKQVADVKGDVTLLKQSIAKMPHTVALYTLVGSERYSVIVVTGSTAVAREYAITEKELNQKVAAFQEVLRDPHRDARPLAQDLYKILIGPIKTDLDQAQAQTLVWSLDGALRYVPVAALYDGKQFVVEQYNTVTITPVSIPHLGEKPDFSNLSAAAMGISRQYESELPALPAVANELDEVVRNAKTAGAQTTASPGVLPGTILLNGAFTEKAMENLLASPHTVVHIASHFVFRPGDDGQSYLLLAGKDADTSGYHLTVADFRDNQNISLDDTDLLTLSACETGLSGNAANGREVDGLAMMAQLKGARAVISSLWEVNDASTGMLMADFYRRWTGSAGNVSKVDALRQAQLDLLQGNIARQSAAGARGIDVAEDNTGSPAPAGYAHPFYWAPFVLTGNWR